MSRQKKQLITLGIMIIGLALLAYPFVNGALARVTEGQFKQGFEADMASLSDAEMASVKQEMLSYNETIQEDGSSIIDPFNAKDFDAGALLSQFSSDQVVGYVHIPKLDLELPLRLGASDSNLLLGVAQVDGTSMPLGGLGTRSVIGGHRGYAGARMFDDIGELSAGDLIFIRILDEELTYQVTDAEIIDPSQTDRVAPVEGKDLLTLISCDPYPTYQNRLIVNASRVTNQLNGADQAAAVDEEIARVEVPLLIRLKTWGTLLAAVLIPILILFLTIRFIKVWAA